MAPATSASWTCRPKPAVMIRPSPGPATIAAMVAVATTCTAAMRTPFISTGAAGGISTPVTSWRAVMPMPRAAATVSRSTSRMPTYALVSSGGRANRTSARIVASVHRSSPSGSTSSTRTAKVGIARPMLEMLIASPHPRPMCPSHNPIGSAMRAAMNRAMPEMYVCSQRRLAMPSGPLQFALSVSQPHAPVSQSMSPRPSAPGRQPALQRNEQQVCDDREGDTQHGRGEYLGLEVAAIAAVNRISEAAETDDRADCRQRDRGYRGQAQPSKDRRERERQLHAQQHPSGVITHPTRCFHGVGGDCAQRGEVRTDEDHERIGGDPDDHGLDG